VEQWEHEQESLVRSFVGYPLTFDVYNLGRASEIVIGPLVLGTVLRIYHGYLTVKK
jgi:hypothetical protein